MIYVHVPFCRSFCTYCDFYSELAYRCRNAEDAIRQEQLFGNFIDALCAEIEERKDEIFRVFTSSGVGTLYVGGGTPSVLPLSAFEQIVIKLRETGLDCIFKEFTVEVNPEDVVQKGRPYVEGLLRLGVNRISMGVQSFDDGILRFMNRRHSASEAIKAYHILEESGVDNISIDLIFGLSQLSDSLWRETIDKALSISSRGQLPCHISAYQLSVEPGSMLAKMVDKGLWTEATQEKCAEQYDVLCDSLSKAGYRHYEISNFALPGYEAIHNSSYWTHVPYVGLGPGAHSFLPPAGVDSNCQRLWNKEDLSAYLQAGVAGEFSPIRDGEILSEEQLVTEKVMLGLRTDRGVEENYLYNHCNPKAIEESLRAGQLVRTDFGNLRIPESCFFISDHIISDIV